MSTNNNWSKVVVVGNDGLVDRDATIDALDVYLATQAEDQDQMAGAIDAVFAQFSSQKAIVADTVLSLAASKLSTDPERFTSLKEVGSRILAANYGVVKGAGGGSLNPHYKQ